MTDEQLDDQLTAQLRALAAEVDPLPVDVVTAARAAFDLRTLDAELAELVADSLDTAGAVRGASAVRLLSFEADGVTLELEVDESTRTILGEVTGARGPVELDTPAGSREVALDDEGRFSVSDVPSGPVRLRCTSDRGTFVATSWTVL
jgi:hypothetical protein